MYTHIIGTGSAVPSRVLTNSDLAKMVDTSDEWIVSHTGIRQRHVVSPEENASTLGCEAARRALADAGIEAEALGMIIVTTTTPDYAIYPSVACCIQGMLGAKNAAAFDMNAACPGFVFGLVTARGLMQLDDRPVLVISTEIMSRTINWSDRNTCCLFGDGAGAVVLQNSDQPGGLGFHILGADGTGAQAITREGGVRTEETAHQAPGDLKMDGRAVFNFAVRSFCDIVLKTFEHYGYTEKDFAWVVPHQANTRIIDAAVKRIDVPVEKFYVNIDRFANTSSASIPIALDEMKERGLIHRGDRLLFAAFGAGLVYGGLTVEWTK
ncbi:MAG: beta-ketoacyl-ACP synthase III [Kiritimatiellia bacterium]